MIYQFKCEKCSEVKEVDSPLSVGPPKEVTCDCGEKMHRVWGNSVIHIPEYFKATSDSLSPSEIGHRMNSSRPSGRRKVYY